MRWELEFKRLISSKLPEKYYTDMNRYNYHYETMGREVSEHGYDRIRMCVDDNFQADFAELREMIKVSRRLLIE